ncbi:MAG: hypothetical protein ACWGSQ_10065, partial [Longimicrobiales bacterium]
ILAPELRGDPGAMAQDLTQAVREEAEAEAQQQIERQRTQLQNRATGFLRNLLQPRDTAGAVRPDSAAGDTLRPDTIPPDTVRPDTTPPDTVKPDTVNPDTIKPDTTKPDTTKPDTIGSDRASPYAVPAGLFPPGKPHPSTLETDPFRYPPPQPPFRHAP